MEFPFHSSHTHHHHHHRKDEESENYPPPGTAYSSFDNPPPPPPQSLYGVHEPPPPPQVFHTSHVTPGRISDDYNYSSFPPPPSRPQPHSDSYNYNYQSEAPPPPGPGYYPPNTTTSVHHVAHETHHTHLPHFPSFTHHRSHQGIPDLSNKPTVRVVTKAASDYSLTIRDGKVILSPSDPRDEYQHWYKDEKYSTRVKDEEGCPSFALVNKVTGEAIKHSAGASHPVQLIPYNPDRFDESILWTESRNLGDGYRAIRMVNNVHLNVDAFHGDKRSGGVHDGTTIVLWDWNKGDNQRWKILPYCKFLFPEDTEIKILERLYHACSFRRCLLLA